MKVIMDKQELERCMAYWKPILGLSEWGIFVKIAHKGDMDLTCVSGEIEYNFTGREAQIRILHQEDWPSTKFDQDMERTLVHEMLHLKFDHVCHPKGDINMMHHQLLNDMAISLVTVKRRNDIKAKEK